MCRSWQCCRVLSSLKKSQREVYGALDPVQGCNKKDDAKAKAGTRGLFENIFIRKGRLLLNLKILFNQLLSIFYTKIS